MNIAVVNPGNDMRVNLLRRMGNVPATADMPQARSEIEPATGCDRPVLRPVRF